MGAGGMLKRFLSFGRKKSKKHSAQTHDVDQMGVPQVATEDSEAVVNQLLRSSSSRFAVVKEVDYSSLPPIPHPINDVLNTPTASTASIASSTLSQRGTYTVKVHKRQQHSSTEFPNANRVFNDSDDEDFTTPRPRRTQDKNDSQVIRLRSDPSVLSLLDLYDDHGRLLEGAFSNSPEKDDAPKEGRAQKPRAGSTLRQLLGDPPSTPAAHQADVTNAAEGDISWAERYLRDVDSRSSASSLPIQTPNDFDSHFPNNHLTNVHNDSTFSSVNDISNDSAISSMNVEVSIATDSISHEIAPQAPHEQPKFPQTPRRASQVFGFLAEKKRSTGPEEERPLPELPSYFSSPSNEGVSLDDAPHSYFSDASSEFTSHYLSRAIPKSRDIPRTPATPNQVFGHTLGKPTVLHSYANSPAPARSRSASVTSQHRGQPPSSTHSDDELPPDMVDMAEVSEGLQARKVKVIMVAPTKVIVTAPTPSNNPLHNLPPTRIPRGPRSHYKPTSLSSKPTLLDRSNSDRSSVISNGDPFTTIPARKHKARKTSNASVSENEVSGPYKLGKTRPKSRTVDSKENSLGLQAKPELPFTPIRSNSRSLFRTAVDPSMFCPPPEMVPSPASSSELSPVGKKLMMNVRSKRTRARGVERHKSGRRF